MIWTGRTGGGREGAGGTELNRGRGYKKIRKK